METSILIGRLFAVIYLSVGLGMLLRPVFYRELIDDMSNSPGVLYLGGLMALAAGLLIVMYHNIWQADWRLVITLFGWMGLLKGILLTVLPDLMLGQFRVFTANTQWLYMDSMVLCEQHLEQGWQQTFPPGF